MLLRTCVFLTLLNSRPPPPPPPVACADSEVLARFMTEREAHRLEIARLREANEALTARAQSETWRSAGARSEARDADEAARHAAVAEREAREREEAAKLAAQVTEHQASLVLDTARLQNAAVAREAAEEIAR